MITNKFALLTMTLVAVASLVSCGHGITKLDKAQSEAKVDGVISVWPSWIKDKGKKFDLQLNIVNLDQKQGIIVMLQDMSCKRGDIVGTLKHTFFNTGERTIDLKPGQAKSFNMVCTLPAIVKGDYLVTFGKVYANPKLDGYTQGPVLAQSLVWKYSDVKK